MFSHIKTLAEASTVLQELVEQIINLATPESLVTTDDHGNKSTLPEGLLVATVIATSLLSNEIAMLQDETVNNYLAIKKE